jgi:hypothetical protein
MLILDKESESSGPSSTSMKLYDIISFVYLPLQSTSSSELPIILFNSVFLPTSMSPRKIHVASGALNRFELSFRSVLHKFLGSFSSSIATLKDYVHLTSSALKLSISCRSIMDCKVSSCVSFKPVNNKRSSRQLYVQCVYSTNTCRESFCNLADWQTSQGRISRIVEGLQSHGGILLSKIKCLCSKGERIKSIETGESESPAVKNKTLMYYIGYTCS